MVEAAEAEGFKFNGKENLIELESFSKKNEKGRHANHPKYSEYIRKQMDEVDLDKGSAKEQLQSIIDKIKKDIEENTNKRINDLYNP